MYVLTNLLKLFHPFIPFITEKIYQELPNHQETIMLAAYPKAGVVKGLKNNFTLVIDAIKSIRNARSEFNVPDNKRTNLYVLAGSDRQLVSSNLKEIAKLGFGLEISMLQSEKLDEKCVKVISTLATIPVTWSLLSNMETMGDAFNYVKLFSGMPILLKLWYVLVSTVCLFIFISNIVRRLNDINGKVNKSINTVVSMLFVFQPAAIFLPFPILCTLGIIIFILGLFLLCKKGTITGKYPYDFTKTFNWGAFFGTWIWGLFNKSYKTLWIFLLGLTPAGLYYALICGLKGNEWAYKNKKWESDEKFRKSQDIQTIVFIVLKMVILPIIYLSIILVLAFSFAFVMYCNSSFKSG